MKHLVCILGLLYLSSNVHLALASQTVEETVRDYFADIPVMVEIARCESKFRQFTDSGNVLRGGVGGQMVGVFQFFDRYHTGTASELGFNIETLEGNLAYARYIYGREGTTPWISAQDCWDVPQLRAATPEPLAAVTQSESAGVDVTQQKITLLKQVVMLLQTILELKLSEV